MTDPTRPMMVAEVVARVRRDVLIGVYSPEHSSDLVILCAAANALSIAEIENRDLQASNERRIRVIRELHAESDELRTANERLQSDADAYVEVLAENARLRAALEHAETSLRAVMMHSVQIAMAKDADATLAIIREALTPRDPAAQGVEAERRCRRCGMANWCLCPSCTKVEFESGAGASLGLAQNIPTQQTDAASPAPDSPTCPRCQGSGYAVAQYPDGTSDRGPCICTVPEAGKPTDVERLDWLEANWMEALTQDDVRVESEGRSLRDMIDYHHARAQREREE